MATQDTICWVFAYDITDDRLRGRISRKLEQRAARVQASVFEARLTKKEARALFQHLAPLLDPGDSLRVYALPPSALELSMTEGGTPLPEDGPFWIL